MREITIRLTPEEIFKLIFVCKISVNEIYSKTCIENIQSNVNKDDLLLDTIKIIDIRTKLKNSLTSNISNDQHHGVISIVLDITECVKLVCLCNKEIESEEKLIKSYLNNSAFVKLCDERIHEIKNIKTKIKSAMVESYSDVL